AELARAGRVVVSGLARGVDAEAHAGALATGRTVAVLGHGLGFTAPRSHERLRGQILAAGGAMVSVWPDDLAPVPHTFPRRNVWIAGLAEAVVVVEAGERSGALITADAAAREGRDVYAVPGPIDQPASAGCNRLIEEGAGVIVDVASFVAAHAGAAVARADGWQAWVDQGAPVDEVARRLGRPVTEVIGWLTRGELDGTWVRLGGQRWALRR
ncbi:MAG TPA: DNA-processing protein DprA, partial [Myxococcota bacterium]|nr:DNA-processing protein DprA [Myxococcota bacterium]